MNSRSITDVKVINLINTLVLHIISLRFRGQLESIEVFWIAAIEISTHFISILLVEILL